SGPRVAVVTTSGGSGILAADALARHGLELAALDAATVKALDGTVPAYGATANPVDVTASVMSNAALFDQALAAIVGDDGVDIVVACFCVLTGHDVDQVVSSLTRAADRSGKPVLVARTGADHLAPSAGAALREAGIPAYPTPARAVRAAGALWQVASRSPKLHDHLGWEGGADLRESSRSPKLHDQLRRGDGEHAVKRVLADAGVAVPRGRLAGDAGDAVSAVAEVGGRAVLKAVVPGLTHKTEAGAVALAVTGDTAAATFARLAALGGAVLVEEMVDGGVEALVGVAASALGPVMTVGPGGVLTEVVDDVAVRLLPVTREDVEGMLDETRLGRLLAGVRGAAAADRDALVDLVCTVGGLAATWSDGGELDLNPVAVLPAGRGVRVLDAAYVAPHERAGV
ncbi:MAG: acetate--CoA ligase family protein, partial [Actinomycetes bacterium]